MDPFAVLLHLDGQRPDEPSHDMRVSPEERSEPPSCVAFGDLHDPLERFEGFIFDCDGTLADTMPLHHRAWLHALERAGARFAFDWDLFTSRAGMSLEHTVLELNRQFAVTLDPAFVALSQREFFEGFLKEVTPIEPVVQLARLAAERRRVSVASGSVREHVIHTLELCGVISCFDVIVTPADVQHGKPAPDMFLLAAELMGVAPQQCLVIEDSELGILAAHRAGMHAALVPSRRPASPSATLRGLEP